MLAACSLLLPGPFGSPSRFGLTFHDTSSTQLACCIATGMIFEWRRYLRSFLHPVHAFLHAFVSLGRSKGGLLQGARRCLHVRVRERPEAKAQLCLDRKCGPVCFLSAWHCVCVKALCRRTEQPCCYGGCTSSTSWLVQRIESWFDWCLCTHHRLLLVLCVFAQVDPVLLRVRDTLSAGVTC